PAVGLPDLLHLLGLQLLHQITGDGAAVVHLSTMPDPLPNLGPADLRRGHVFHQVVDGGGAGAPQPGGDVLQADGNVVAQALLGDLAAFDVGVQQVVGGDVHFVPLAVHLVDLVAQVLLEDAAGHLHQAGVGHPGAVGAVVHLADLVLAHLFQGPGVDLGVAPAGN